MKEKIKLNHIEQWTEEIARHIKGLTPQKRASQKSPSPQSKKRFKRVDKTKLIGVQCPHCLCRFGLESKFVNSMEDGINFQYGCPYCGKMGRLEND